MAAERVVVLGADAAAWCRAFPTLPSLRGWDFRPTIASELAGLEGFGVVVGPADELAKPEVESWRVTFAPTNRPIALELPASPDAFFATKLPHLVETGQIRQALAVFAELGGGEFVAEMVDLFSSQTPEQIRQLRAATSTGDLPTAQRAAHSMKSSFANFGARPLQRQALALEMAARSQQTRTLETGIEDLWQGYGRFRERLGAEAAAFA